jgi:hypothetical protein
MTLGPVFPGVFARVRWPSRFSNQSGRTVQIGFVMRFFRGLRSFCGLQSRAALSRVIATQCRSVGCGSWSLRSPLGPRPKHDRLLPPLPDAAHRRGSSAPYRLPTGRSASMAARTRSAADSGCSCSQIRITCQPAAVSSESTRSSRSRLRSSFARQYSLFVRGIFPCLGQQCQKQPSTNTAIRRAGNTMSARCRRPLTGRRFLKNLRPSRWSADRNATSGLVFAPRLPRIAARTPGELGGGGLGSGGRAPISDAITTTS